MEVRDRSGKALAGQFGQRPVKAGGLEREVTRLGAIGLARPLPPPPAPCQRLLARGHPQREVRQPWRALEPDLREIAESAATAASSKAPRMRGRRSENSAPELAPRPAGPRGVILQELDDQRTVEKIRALQYRGRDGVEDQRASRVEYRFIMVAVE